MGPKEIPHAFSTFGSVIWAGWAAGLLVTRLVWSNSGSAAAGGDKHGNTVIMSSDHVASATHGTMRIFKLAMRRASFADRVTWIDDRGKTALTCTREHCGVPSLGSPRLQR